MVFNHKIIAIKVYVKEEITLHADTLEWVGKFFKVDQKKDAKNLRVKLKINLKMVRQQAFEF